MNSMKSIILIVLLFLIFSWHCTLEKKEVDNLNFIDRDAIYTHLIQICNKIMKWRVGSGRLENIHDDCATSIFINGNMARVLICTYELTGKRDFLEEGLRYCRYLANYAMPVTTSKGHEAFWWYDTIKAKNLYLADTGTAMAALYKALPYLNEKERTLFMSRLNGFFRLITEGTSSDPTNRDLGASPGWICADSGALGVGYYRGQLETRPYTVSTAQAGLLFATQYFKLTKNLESKKMAINAASWLLDNFAEGALQYRIMGEVWPHHKFQANHYSIVQELEGINMEPYERVITAMSHRAPDRPPINYIATSEIQIKLKSHLGIDDDEALRQFIDADIRYVAPRYVGPKGTTGAAGVGADGKDFLGIVWKPVKNEFGTYNEIAFHPLGHVTTVEEVENYSWPSVDWFDFSHLKEEIARLNTHQRYAIIYFAGGAFETPWYMRGMERFLMDLVECPEIAEAISRHAMEFYKERAMRAIEASDGQIDIIGSGGDLGSQKGMMLSPELWRKHIKPYSEQLIRPFKEMGLKTFYHSCGSIVPVIEDFIEMGLDILDPIQPKAAGMEPDALKYQFGTRLTFHGGVDEQELLPRSTAEEVSNEVQRLIDILGKDGGYIVCSAHAIQPDTPVENILAMYEAAKHYCY